MVPLLPETPYKGWNRASGRGLQLRVWALGLRDPELEVEDLGLEGSAVKVFISAVCTDW